MKKHNCPMCKCGDMGEKRDVKMEKKIEKSEVKKAIKKEMRGKKNG